MTGQISYLLNKRRMAIRSPVNANAAIIIVTTPNRLTPRNCNISLASTSKIKMAEPTKVNVAKIAKKIVLKERFL